jgi:hypothetical protein
VRTIQSTHTQLCGQNAKFKYVKASGTYSNQWALKGMKSGSNTMLSAVMALFPVTSEITLQGSLTL